MKLETKLRYVYAAVPSFSVRVYIICMYAWSVDEENLQICSITLHLSTKQNAVNAPVI